MAGVKPDEISSILKDQLSNVKTVSELEEVSREVEFKIEYLKVAPEKEKVPMNNTH